MAKAATKQKLLAQKRAKSLSLFQREQEELLARQQRVTETAAKAVQAHETYKAAEAAAITAQADVAEHLRNLKQDGLDDDALEELLDVTTVELRKLRRAKKKTDTEGTPKDGEAPATDTAATAVAPESAEGDAVAELVSEPAHEHAA